MYHKLIDNLFFKLKERDDIFIDVCNTLLPLANPNELFNDWHVKKVYSFIGETRKVDLFGTAG